MSLVITCPQCSRRYLMEEETLGESGCQVRCAVCEYSWHQDPPVPEVVLTVPLEEDVLPQKKPRVKSRISFKSWIFLTLGMLGLLGILLIGRPTIDRWVSQLSFLLTMVGLNSPPSTSGLMIKNVKMVEVVPPSEEKTLFQKIIVHGEISNSTTEVKSLPPLIIQVIGLCVNTNLPKRADGRCILDQWEHRLSQKRLLVGESLPFETPPHPRVDGAEEVSVTF